LTDDYDEAERAAYDEDRAAQDAVDDAKYDAMMPEQDEPEDWHQGAPTHYALAEELIDTVGRMEYGTNESRETLMLAQVRATLAATDQLADVVSILKQERHAKPADPWASAGLKSPTDPAALGEWLRGLSHATILRDKGGFAWQRMWGANFNHGDDSRDQWPSLYSVGLEQGRSIENAEDGSPGEDLRVLADRAPFTVLDPGAPF